MNVAVFASGNGSNFENLVELSKIGYLKGKISYLITDRECLAIEKSKKFSIPYLISKNEDEILKELKNKNINFIVLAGYLSKIGPKIIESFYGKIVNIHPALLPSFGGKGFYGNKIHSIVKEKGLKISGITIHYVDNDYDTGPIIFQKQIQITNFDTISTIEEKIHNLEYFYYPFILNMIFEGIIKLENKNIIIDHNTQQTSKHALISVTDKNGIIDFAKKLNEKGYLIISTGGTYKILKENKVKVTKIESITGFDEMLDGRVKTLNNTIFAGILSISKNKKYIKEINEFFIPKINLVVVNLYNFKEASKKYQPFDDSLMENIDIGGVTLLRAAAKNWQDVIVVCDTNDYDEVLREIENPSDEFKRKMALKAFKHTKEYDEEIVKKLSDEKIISISIQKVSELRYGENPHQKASFYSLNSKLPFVQLWGKELSYNNILDAYGSWQAVCDFEMPCCVIFKHVTPCGIAIDNDVNKAFEKAYICDPISAFGGIIAINRKITKNIAEFLSDKFIEIISAPDFEPQAIEILKKKKNLRILKWEQDIRNSKIIKSIGDEFIITEPDNIIIDKDWNVVSGEITEEEKQALIFAFTCVKHVKSNAIVLASNDATLGIGAGQMSRIDAVHIAFYKFSQYLQTNSMPKIVVMASDAFFPFPDAVIKAKEIGVSAIIQPGGSVRDLEVISKAKELNIKMVFTGIRHFKH
ncbi:MAG: bifunctional phosphoribosylaminoimidazolecarboxamide formyltransferase/IMP cyclohydrolase [Elusimicrobiales bacterium]|nr:bifunctional phosphoribosylaminoimidazolecarboxamide formyltransferase/IMP cyclohydrolase [Elusimicrobiales bacterium]